jgi:beta-galactosidase
LGGVVFDMKGTVTNLGWRFNIMFVLSAIFCPLIATPVAARQHEMLDAGWRFHLYEADGNSSVAPPGVAVTQWVWITDDNATNDADTMAAPGLDTSTWTNVSIGTDVFNGRQGFAWFRATIIASKLSYQPAAIYFSGVDDNAWVYLNGVLIGQHQGWSQAFSISSFSSTWIKGGTNVLAVAVQNTGGPGGISAAVLLQSASPQVQPSGIPVAQWIWQKDINAPNDSATMAATNLDASSWQTAFIGQDVFNDTAGSAWFRTTLDGIASSARPLTLHFLGVNDNTTIYLNGILLGQHVGNSQPFDISVPDAAWSTAGPNILAVAVQDTGGPGGLMEPVILQSGNQVPPPGIPVAQWIWLADSDAPGDAATMAANTLDTSNWPNVAAGQNLFPTNRGAIWLRATLDNFATGGRPLTLHFLNLGSNVTANVYLNGASLGQFGGTFDLPIPDGDWVNGGPNILAIALQNTNGYGGILNPVLLQSGEDIEDFSPADPDFNDSSWRTVHLPHDYIVEGTFTNAAETSHASLPLANAWYRLKFPVPISSQGQSVWIGFDGVYHNSKAWINGHYLGYWYSGYAPFRYDISRFVLPGQTNVLAVHVDPHDDEGWWYEGGGIYRHVWLTIANPLHVAPWGTFVTSAVQGSDTNGNTSAALTIATTITNTGSQDQSCTLISQAIGPDSILAGIATTQITVPSGVGMNVIQTIQVTNAQLWSLDTPQLYQLQTAIQQNDQTVDSVTTPFGIRSIFFDANKGFFLNGKHVEIQGMCNHQDFAGVGIAIPDDLLYWRIMKLKQMGANAYRCSHNPPTTALLDACDRLGMLVMDENRHLGDSTGGYSSATAQTTYADLSPLNNMILRDRNHPSIILWSMCNEESISGTQAGADIFEAMKKRVQEFDTSRPISCAMNSGWFNVGISLVEDVEGFNYSPGEYDAFHEEFPSQPMYGSETASAQTDRGMYTNDGVAYVSAYTTTPEASWQPVATRPYMAGAFIWTGFDYKGEPSPYGWPCISSKFGNMDLCGLPKDDYYYYQACWGNQPLVHIFPHWNWTMGQTITVWCYGNTTSVELFLNGVSQGVQTMPAYGHVAWSVPYSPGTLLAKGYDASGNVIATDQVVTTSSPAAIKLTTDRTTLTADNEDVTVVYASIVDAQGRVVPTASNLVTFAVSDPACLDGVGNGDPASHEPDKASQRHAFNGWCMALVGSTNSAGSITFVATSPGLTSATLNLQSIATNSPPPTPTSLIATSGNAQASLRWDLIFDATSYNIKRAVTSNGPYTTIANTTAVAFNNTGLNNGTTYYYMVSAVNAYGQSADSSEVSVTPIASSALAPPTGVASQRDDGQVILNWNASVGATSYNVERASGSGGPYTSIASVATPGYTDTTVTNGTTYYYVVSAVNSGLESVNSAPVSATPASMSFLVGTSIGSSGSWNNSGNIREMALDGNLSTFFDPSNANAWVGIDLGTNIANAICKIRYAPRSGYESRMTDGNFQGANQSDFSDATTLYTITNTPPDGFTSCFPTNMTPFRYLRYQAAANNWCNIAELEFYCLGPRNYRLSGDVIGTSGSWNGDGNTITNAVDGDITTFFDGPTSNGNWVGLDLGSAKQITNIRFFPQIDFADRMNGGVFQGANVTDFSTAVNFWTLTDAPPDSTFTARVITNVTPVRFVRYLGPDDSYCDVAEVQFFSSSPSVTAVPSSPADLIATPGNQEVALSWNASPGAISYNIKRAMVSGGTYTTITNCASTLYMDTGLDSGTYYYVVSAVNSIGDSSDSTEATATVDCTISNAPSELAATEQNGLLLLTWFPVSAGTSPTTYNVLRSINTVGSYELLATGLTATNYCDNTAASGVTYYYLVQAINSCGQSPNSSVLNITSLPSPQLGIDLNGNQLLLSWPSWAADYTIYATTNLDLPESWQPVTDMFWNSNGMLYFILPVTNDTQQFFRLESP